MDVKQYSLIEYVTESREFVDVSKNLGTRHLPCRCEFGFVVEFTGTPTDRDTISVELVDSEDRNLFRKAFVIDDSEIVAGRADFRLDPVRFPKPGVYTVRAYLGTSVVFSRALTLVSCVPT